MAELSLFLHRLRDLVKRPPITCRREASAVEVARLLAREEVGSVVVVDDDGAPVGIVTDRDLRQKVVANGCDPAATPARAIMTSPLVTLRPSAFAFEAVLEMTRRRIRHLVVMDEGRLVGVVSSRDFLALQTTHPVLLAREIARATSVVGLADMATRATALVQRLVDEGGTAYDIGQIVAELNDRIVLRALALTAGALEEAGESAPPGRYCWLAFGSEARREQTLRTDQDNGLVYDDPAPREAERTAAYYGRLAAAVIDALVQVGFPRCPGDVMASNPTWCQPLTTWQGYFRRWIETPVPEAVLSASIFFDLRPLAGALDLGSTLTDLVRAQAPSHTPFLRLLAHDVVSRHVPVTLFGNVAAPRRGPRRGAVDIKVAGSLQLVGAARVHALSLGLGETNTVDRIRAAAERDLYTPEAARELTDAYQHLMRLRLVHQLHQLGQGQAPDNWIDVRGLSRADGLLLRDALRTVVRVQDEMRERFMTSRLG